MAMLLGVTTLSCAAVGGFVACSSSSSNGSGTDAGSDQQSGGDDATMDSGPGVDSGPGMDATEGGPGPGMDASGKDSGGGGGDSGGEAGNEDASDGGGGMCTVYDASMLDDASVAAGFQQVWQVYKCWKCHQDPTDVVDDAGNGILLNGRSTSLSDAGAIFPPNLTNSAEALGCWSDQQIMTAILQGLDPEGGTLCPPMPVFGNDASTPGRPMDAGTAQAIIDYLRSLTPSNKTVPDTTCASGGDAAADGPVDAGGQ